MVVTGEGRAFSSGFDLREFAGGDTGEPRPAPPTSDAGWPTRSSRMSALTIAAIKGPCVGGGVVLASACDLRIAADDTVFSIPEVDLGIPLAWGGIPRLVREIGPAMTRELVLTCRPFDAEEARSIGFVNRVVPRDQLESTVEELAGELALKAPNVVRTTKRQVNEALEAMSSTTGSWADADLLTNALRDPEARAAAQAYLAGPPADEPAVAGRLVPGGSPRQPRRSVVTWWKKAVVRPSDSTSMRSLWPWNRAPYSLASSDGLNRPAP